VKINWAETLRQRVHNCAESLGNLFVESFHYLALFAIGGVTAWAAVMAFLGMLEKGHIAVDDILLLFIYLELGAMVGFYFKTKGNVTNIFGFGLFSEKTSKYQFVTL
jgi:phosphate starvation-inducible membrane PsiE